MHIKYQVTPKAILLLEDGKVFEGKAAGEIRELWAWTCGQLGMSTGAQAVPA